MSICNRNCCENKINSSYIKWLIEILGPVILGSKPSEILNISSKDKDKDSKLNDINSFFSNCSKLTYNIINISDGGVRIIFINRTSLSNVLNNKKCLNFLKFIGYPSEYNLDNYIDLLIDKLQTKDFPHEIGIFCLLASSSAFIVILCETVDVNIIIASGLPIELLIFLHILV